MYHIAATDPPSIPVPVADVLADLIARLGYVAAVSPTTGGPILTRATGRPALAESGGARTTPPAPCHVEPRTTRRDASVADLRRAMEGGRPG